MRIIHCACGGGPSIPGAQRHDLPDIPSRKDLRFLDAIAKELSLIDDTPTLTNLTSNPEAAYLGEPGFAVQKFSEPLRVIVSGSDAALSAVLTRMMRGDYLWAEVAFVPLVPPADAGDTGSVAGPAGPATTVWGLDGLSVGEAVAVAVNGNVSPLPCIRTDAGIAVAGSVTALSADSGPFIGEVVVDSSVLVSQAGPEGRGFFARRRFSRTAARGVRIVPTQDAPGLAAVSLVPGAPARGGELRPDPSTVLTGRAAQIGGPGFHLFVDEPVGVAGGVDKRKALTAATIYRHLRDIQAVRIGKGS